MSNPKRATFASAGKISQHLIPGAYSRITSAGQKLGFASTSNLAFLGVCDGGEPNTLLWFGSFDDAKLVIKDGTLLEVLREAFNPGGDFTPQRIGVIRVNNATQASLNLQNGLDNIILVTSKDYGLWNNQISIKVEDGSVVGSKVVTEKYQTSENSTRDIIKESLSVIYTGTGTAADLDITTTAFATTVTAGPGGEDLNLLFASYPTIGELVEAINAAASGVYTATILTGTVEDESVNLDAVSTVSILTVVILYSNVVAMIEAINAELSFVEASLVTAADYLIPDNIAYTRLSGATAGTSTSTEWSAAFTTSETEDIQLVGLDTDDAAIVALTSAHLNKMNSVDGKSERQSIVGGETSLDYAKAQSVSTNNFALSFAWMDFTNYNSNNVLTTFNSIHYAAKLLGQASAANLNTPLTFKSLSVVECLTKLTKTEKEDAILKGVIIPEVAPNGVVRTVRSITSYQGSDLKYAEFSIVRQMLYISRDFRILMEDSFIGEAGIKQKLVSIDTLGRDRLSDYENDLEIIVADPNDPVNNPAWWDFIWELDGDTIRLRFGANITAPINFMFNTHYFDLLVSVSQ